MSSLHPQLLTYAFETTLTPSPTFTHSLSYTTLLPSFTPTFPLTPTPTITLTPSLTPHLHPHTPLVHPRYTLRTPLVHSPGMEHHVGDESPKLPAPVRSVQEYRVDRYW